MKVQRSVTYESQGPPWEFGWNSIDQHVGLRSDDCGVDKPEEEEASDQGTDCVVGSVRVFSLFKYGICEHPEWWSTR